MNDKLVRKQESEPAVAVQPDEIAIMADQKIIALIDDAADSLKEDRKRAIDFYEELLALFEAGANKPADKRELNVAQQMAQGATTNMINLIQAFVKLRNGESKVQIANVQGEGFTREKLIELIEEADKK